MRSRCMIATSKDTRLVSNMGKDTQIVIRYLDTGTVRGYIKIPDSTSERYSQSEIRDKVYPPWEKGYFPCIIEIER